ncbi:MULTISPECIES: hypothetical protein [Rhodomicrobium]|uniref:hypothetical protein n=1 Tax=Rhodomicrobium TaxID=1068 RepID=UPI000B4B8661|nr:MULTISPECIES: hypothetical protein [Rhodomicrobium]
MWHALTQLAAIAPLFVAASAVVGAAVAVLGYRKWHPEATGKRKIELAEDILTGIYEVREVIAWARSPAGFVGEAEGRPRAEDEDPGHAQMRDAYFRTIARLEQDKAAFSNLQAKKYRAMACFGQDAGQPFLELKAPHAQIGTAALSLIRTWPPHGVHMSAQCRKWEAIIGWGYEPNASDAIQQELEQIIRRFEELFGKSLLREGAG